MGHDLIHKEPLGRVNYRGVKFATVRTYETVGLAQGLVSSGVVGELFVLDRRDGSLDFDPDFFSFSVLREDEVLDVGDAGFDRNICRNVVIEYIHFLSFIGFCRT